MTLKERWAEEIELPEPEEVPDPLLLRVRELLAIAVNLEEALRALEAAVRERSGR